MHFLSFHSAWTIMRLNLVYLSSGLLADLVRIGLWDAWQKRASGGWGWMTIPPVSFIPPVLWVENRYILLPKATALLRGGRPSHRSNSCWIPLLAPLLCLCRDPGLVAKPRVFPHPYLIFLDSAHTLETVSLLNSPQSPIWDFHLFSIGSWLIQY